MQASENTTFDLSRIQSPRPETPEPGSQQGRRNADANIQLLDKEGAISDDLERCLMHIFSKYCTPPPAEPQPHAKGNTVLLVASPTAVLTPAGLDKWAKDTNGSSFSDETKEELTMFMDVNDDGNLTFKGFLQIYQLQTENDEEETWRDLSSHGFDRRLRLVTTRREEMDMDEGSSLHLTEQPSPSSVLTSKEDPLKS